MKGDKRGFDIVRGFYIALVLAMFGVYAFAQKALMPKVFFLVLLAVAILYFVAEPFFTKVLAGIAYRYGKRWAQVKHQSRMPDYKQLQAKKFFINRIIAQAERDKISLSKAEQYMLNFTEVEASFDIDPQLQEQYDKETTDEEFEKKIVKLLKRAYAQDVSRDSNMKRIYKESYKDLSKGDHYILIMIDDAIGLKLKLPRLF